MNAVEEQQIKRKLANLELRVAKLEALLLKSGVQIGETEHGDIVWSVGSKTGGPSGATRMGSALLGKKQ